MACSLTYDSTLARVRIDADELCVTGTEAVIDTFSRSVTGTWTTADTGQSWTVTGASASEFGVSGGFGTQNNTTENVFRTSTLDVGTTNCDFTVTVATDKVVSGATQAAELLGRYADANNHYLARISFTTTTVNFDVRKRVAGVTTTLSNVVTALTHGAGTRFAARLSVSGSTVRAKLWLASTVEPADWTVTATDTALVTGTQLGVQSILFVGTGNEPIVFSWDDLRTSSASTATIDRTIDSVTYTIVRGASEVGVTTGCELEQVIDDYEFPVGVPITYRVRTFTDEGDAAVTTTCQITINLDDVWLKSIGRPFLNRAMRCVGNPTPITRRARNGVFPIVGRSFPVAVTDVRSGREVPLQVITKTTQERQDLDLLIASGDPIFVQTPLAHPLPTMYAVVGDTAEARPVRNRLCDNDWRLWDLPLTEVAAPGPDVVGSTSTWQTVVSTYATWADVMAAHATWASVLELIGDGSEVIVP